MASTNRTVYKNDWQKEHTDRISLAVPKGRKEELQEYAQQHGESLNGFIKRAISKTLELDGAMDLLKKRAADCNISVQEAQEKEALMQAVKLIDSKIPGFKDLYDSGQIPDVIARRTMVIWVEPQTEETITCYQ